MKKWLKEIVSFIVVLTILSSCIEKHYNEWVEKDGNKYYYDEQGRMLKNCYSKIGNDTYVFNSEGSLISDSIVNLDGKASYVDFDGKVKQYGWFSLDGHDYFVYESVLATGWSVYLGNWYYLDPNNYYMLKNQWVENEYYVDNNGKMVSNGWHTINGKKYYFDTTGKVDRNRMNITFRNIPYKQHISRSRFEADDIYCTVSSIYFENKKAWCKGVIEDTHGRNYPLCDATVYYRIYDGRNRIISSKKIYIEHRERNSKYFEVNFNFPFSEIDENDNYVIEITGMNYGLY